MYIHCSNHHTKTQQSTHSVTLHQSHHAVLESRVEGIVYIAAVSHTQSTLTPPLSPTTLKRTHYSYPNHTHHAALESRVEGIVLH